MKLKRQFLYHARPLALAALLVIAVLGVWYFVAPTPPAPGRDLADIPFYKLPFGADDAGNPRPFWPSRMVTASGRMADAARLPSSADCASCHRTEFEEWAGSLHAAAGRDRVYEATVEANKVIGRHGPEQARFCEGCHAPGELLSGRTNRFASVPPQDALTEGISCISCHTATHADPIAGNGALTIDFDRAEREADGPQGAALLADPRAHLAAFGAPDTVALVKSADLCGGCHTEIYDESMSRAAVPQDVQSTYVEWRDSWYGRNNITCQDCHMAADPAAQVMRLREGKAQKPDRYSHRFIGANVVMADTRLDDALMVLRGGFLPGVGPELNDVTLKEQFRQTEAFLRTAAGLELRKAEVDAAGLHLAIAVQNLGAGHNLPTGVNDQKHLELEVSLTDASGAEIFRSGGDRPGLVGADTVEAVRWIEDFIGTEGQAIPDHLTFRTAAVVWQRDAIAPRGEDVVHYDIPIAVGARGPFRLQARLLYRIARPELLLSSLRIDMAVPSFPLAELSTQIQGPNL
jgi:nitrate/TMAO reductase-like tetraheme cytochrome c subunit